MNLDYVHTLKSVELHAFALHPTPKDPGFNYSHPASDLYGLLVRVREVRRSVQSERGEVKGERD